MAVSEAADVEQSRVQHAVSAARSPNGFIRHINGPLLAFKALGIGTMLSIGGVGLFTAGECFNESQYAGRALDFVGLSLFQSSLPICMCSCF